MTHKPPLYQSGPNQPRSNGVQARVLDDSILRDSPIRPADQVSRGRNGSLLDKSSLSTKQLLINQRKNCQTMMNDTPLSYYALPDRLK